MVRPKTGYGPKCVLYLSVTIFTNYSNQDNTMDKTNLVAETTSFVSRHVDLIGKRVFGNWYLKYDGLIYIWILKGRLGDIYMRCPLPSPPPFLAHRPVQGHKELVLAHCA